MDTHRRSRVQGRSPFQAINVRFLSGLGFMLLAGWLPSNAATVVTDHLINETHQTQTNVPITFGQVFKAGDVPRGATLTATLDGKPITLQVDVKATNPDGSLRHAVVTTILPSLRGGADLPLVLATDTASDASNAPLSLPQLLGTQYDARISMDIDGATYAASARALLQAANTANTCKAWGSTCNAWLAGPLVSEWVVKGPVIASDGSKNPHLVVYFAVRAYAAAAPGTVGRVRTDVVVENSNAFAPQGQPRYTATVTSGTANYTSPMVKQIAYTRWHHVLWWNDQDPRAYLRQNTGYIQATKAISRYMDLKPGPRFLDKVRQTCAPLDHCDQTPHMGNAGAQDSIGPLPRWTSVYIVDPDVRAYRWMLANTDALGAYSFHYRDEATGFPVSIRKHPYVTIIDWAYANSVAQQDTEKGRAYRADLLPNCTDNTAISGCTTKWYNTGNRNLWDNAHQPSSSYVPYMVTGSWYYMSELAFSASHNEIWSNEAYRGYSKGLIDDAHSQVRGKAWVLREMADAAWLLPDSYPLKAEFIADVVNSLADWNHKYTNNPKANALGLMKDGPVYNVRGGSANGIAPWQHSFLTWSAGHAAELGFAGAAPFRDWLAKFEIGLMTDWQSNPTHGYCWLQASAYSIQVKDADRWLPSYTAVYGATFPGLVGLECNSSAMVAKMAKWEKKPWRAGEMSGYPYSPVGFPANLQVGLAAAVDSGLPNAKAAWQLFESRSVKPTPPQGYNNYPNFAVLPRSVSR